MNSAGTAQLTLTLGGHLGKDMALVSALALEAGTGLLEPFRGTTMGFLFSTHCLTPHLSLSGSSN